MGQARGESLCLRESADHQEPLLNGVRKEEPQLGRYARCFIFVLFTQVVQALMSYDGGATQFCTSSLARNGWTPFLLGLLGAMDKFGQVATAFVWGEVLMRRDAKILLVVGLFWKASCCLIFGRLQEQPVATLTQIYMLAAKLGMGVTEALVSVWATVWVQRNAPQDSRARWLGFAGTSAGIGSGVGSGMASLWSPGGAFVVQAMVLFAIWIVLLLTPAWMLRFGESNEEEPEGSDRASELHSSFGDPRQMLAQEVACRTFEAQPSQPLPVSVTLESLRCKGQFLDATADPKDNGFKVRLSKGGGEELRAQFKMKRSHGHTGHVVSLESVRLPGHYLHASGFGETLCIPQSRVKVGFVEEDGSSPSALFRIHRLSEGVVRVESLALPGHYLGATGESASMFSSGVTKVSVSRGDHAKTNWSQFRLREVKVDGFSTFEGDPCCTPTSRGRRPASIVDNFLISVQHRVWLWTAMAISLSCFVTSGISFLWQNTINSVWGFDNAWSFGFFVFSTGLGGLLGVSLGPDIFDRHLGGFQSASGKAVCLLWCKRMMFVAASCSTVCTLLLAEKACHLVATNTQSTVYWQLAVLVACVFSIFVLINSVTGVLYGINTDAVSPEMRTFAAGLTVSFQNVFGFAFGPLLPSTAAELVGRGLPREWPGFIWDRQAVDGAKYAVGMGVALAATWALFTFARLSAVSARVLHISSRRLLDI